jgi:carboxypeptidase Q
LLRDASHAHSFSLPVFGDLISNAAHMKCKRALLSYCLLSATLLCAASTPDSDAARIVTESLRPSSLETNLRRLTDEIGGRVPGTRAMDRAVKWGVESFKAAGADSVHTEDFNLPFSWAEGATQFSATTPIYEGVDSKPDSIPFSHFSVRAVSIAWAPALEDVHHVPIVDVGMGTAEDFSAAGNVSGKIVLVHSRLSKVWADLFGEYMKAPVVIDAAVKGKAKAIAFVSSREHDLLYRHTNSSHGEIDRIPMVLIAREDGERIGRLLGSGHPVWADLAIPNKIGGPITASNVVAELKGSELPDEFVVLGAHLDSWDLGTGALDNGCDAAMVIDALRAIKAAGLRPRRSIRFILFSGEEQGMVGSRAYVKAHRNELDEDAGVVIFDSGTGHVTGFSLGGRKDVVEAATRLVAPLKQFDATTLTTDADWGTDHFDFMLEGVPTFVASNEESNYLVNYHASSDTFDKVDLNQLKNQVAEAAVLSYSLASSAERVGPRLNRAEIEQTLHESHADEQLKAVGMWDEWASGKRGREP